ncbi:MAG: response regulator [Verrucomicrobiota bacterium]
MSKAPIRLLLIEDVPADAMLISYELRKSGIAFEERVVASKREFLEIISSGQCDAIISDYSMPQFNALDALHLLHRERMELPFILVTGSQSEEVAVECIKKGADDYILKSSLKRLPSALLGAIEKREALREKHQAEQNLRRSEEYFRSLIDASSDIITIISEEGQVRFTSPSFERVLGYPRQEVIGQDYFKFVHASDLLAVKELFTNEFTGKSATRPIENRFLKQDGSWRYLESVCRNLSRNLAVGGLVITSRDITERKKLEAHFLRAQRMESIGTLAGGIAHDLNNVLTPILMSLKLLRDLKEQAPPDLLDTLEASAHRGAAIVQQVLSFARGVEGEKGILQLKHPLNEVLKIARDVFPPGVQIRSAIPADLAPINGDPTQLHQVFMNLLVNARDAMSSGGEIRVEAQNVVLDENYARMQPESKPGRYVLVNVSDQGTGISPEIVNKIFEPFFTTKEIGKGTGLGLSTALGIVRSHGGFLSVYSEPGKGSTFKVYLPAADREAAGKPGEKQPPQVPSGQGEWVLVVDDEAAVREIIKVTLENNGYRVATATDGAEAIARLASKAWNIEIVILDMMMPYMDGLSTMRALKRLDPDLKFIAISGLMDQPRTSQLSELGQVEFLAKPFTTEQLLRVLKPDDSETS